MTEQESEPKLCDSRNCTLKHWTVLEKEMKILKIIENIKNPTNTEEIGKAVKKFSH